MTDNMEPTGFKIDADTLAPSELRVVLVCDVVESVRWMEQDEDNAVTRWQAFTQHVRSTIVPAHGGSVVKSTGDGMMIEFPTARGAVQAAAAMHAQAAVDNEKHASALQDTANQAPAHHVQLRTGIHETQARRDAHDLYGHGVNLAARITTLAGPGETIVSAPVRDRLTDSLDGDIEDMGECYLKHVSEPQRVYRVGMTSAEPILRPQREYAELLQPTIAVIPFEARSNLPEHFAIGELIADGVIAQLSQSGSLKVISRLSSTAFRERDFSACQVSTYLNATYILSGAYVVIDQRMLINFELTLGKTQEVVLAHRFTSVVADLFEPKSEICLTVAGLSHTAIFERESKRIELQPLPSLQGYSVLLGGINAMHQSSQRQFQTSKQILDYLNDRYPRSAQTKAWLAKWHVFSSVRGFSLDRKLEAGAALEHTRRALDIDSRCSLALSMEAFVYTHLIGDMEAAESRLQQALQINPNESMAWLFKSVVSSMQEATERAVSESEYASMLSPIDPLAYFYDSIAASAALSAGYFQKAITTSERSLRKNGQHSPTVRVLITAQVESGDIEAARKTLPKLLALQPDLTVTSYLKAGGSQNKTRIQCARALRIVGLAES